MPEIMSISVNGQSQVPTGFRFHPTEEELLQYYLRNKVSYEKIDLDVIRDVDQNKLELWDIQENCKIGTTSQQDWYFFSHKDKKYPTGTRTNRATAAGFWKATGRDKVIYSNGKRIGMRKTLVFYKGRAPHGQKSDWIMHEYRLDDNTSDSTIVSNVTGDGSQEEGWVVCRIFKKKNHLKIPDSPLASSATIHVFDSCDEGALEQILQQMGRSCKEENEGNNNNNGRFARPRGYDSVAINNNNGYLDRLSTTKSDQEVISSIPCDAVFMFLDPLLLGMLQVEYQSKPNSPFETHPVHMWTFLTAICIYSTVLAIKIYVQNHSSYYAQILSHVLLVAGALSSASLVSIFLPRLLEWFLIIIWASMPVIMARRWLRAQLYWVFSGIMNSISQAKNKLNMLVGRMINLRQQHLPK